MSLADREGVSEGRRKEQFFASQKEKEDRAAKELHYQRLITENAKLKSILKLAIADIEDWIFCSRNGEDPESEQLIKNMKDLL